MVKPIIDYKKCTACNVCVEVCPVAVFAKKDSKVMVEKPEECIGCRACEIQCPEEAITLVD